MTVRTWHLEYAFVGAAVSVAVLAGSRPSDWLTAGAVLLSFAHASVADRLAEREAAKATPDVECVRLLGRYWIAKEALWVAVFVSTRMWPALIGCAVFLAHPIWRRAYRARRPLGRIAS